jgi:hypothetical protein
MRYSGATWKPVTNFSSGVTGQMAAHLGLILHTQQGNGGLQGYFSKPGVQASSHFWVSKMGDVEQYVDTDQRAWAQAAGNDSYLSVETEGWVTEPLTAKQMAALAKLYAWGMFVYSFPKRLSERPGQMGFGWHGMGGVAWGNHPGCPGDLRKAQRSAILAAVVTPDEGDWFDMATKDELKAAIREVLAEPVIQNDDGAGKVSILTALYRAYSDARRTMIKLGA